MYKKKKGDVFPLDKKALSNLSSNLSDLKALIDNFLEEKDNDFFKWFLSDEDGRVSDKVWAYTMGYLLEKAFIERDKNVFNLIKFLFRECPETRAAILYVYCDFPVFPDQKKITVYPLFCHILPDGSLYVPEISVLPDEGETFGWEVKREMGGEKRRKRRKW